jgi:predicted lactoylglutathione lyase
MNAAHPRLTLLTLGVKDIAKSAAFYEALGFRRKARGSDGVAFFEAGGLILSLWSAEQLADDAKVTPEGSGFRSVSLAWNCACSEDVDVALERAVTLGAKLLRPPQQVFWGGYTGYFADPDGHIWEVAYNPHFPMTDDGQLLLPD